MLAPNVRVRYHERRRSKLRLRLPGRIVARRGFMTSIADNRPERPSAPPGRFVLERLLSSPVRAGIGIAATAAAYYLGARLGFAVRFPESPHSVLWPPNAILLAALLLVPPRLWGLHILAVLFHWLVKKDNLMAPMFTGVKHLPRSFLRERREARRGSPPRRSASREVSHYHEAGLFRAVLVLGASLALVGLLVSLPG